MALQKGSITALRPLRDQLMVTATWELPHEDIGY